MSKKTSSIVQIKARLAEARTEIVGYGPEGLEFTHVVLAQVGLPRSKTDIRTFERRSGQTAIMLEAGQGPDALGRWSPLPLPYGAHPRLILIHMASEAVRTRSRCIDVGHSIRSFFARLDLSYNAVTLRHFKRQIQCLAAMHMTIAFPNDGRVSTLKCDPILRFDGWLSLDPNQKSLWDDTIELTEPFFETLLSHAVPLDPRAIHALQGSTLALDVYTWLSHRLCRVKEPAGTILFWSSLKGQFGQEYRELRDFKREFKKALSQAVAVYPDARIEAVRGGVKLLPSPSPIPKTQVLTLSRPKIATKQRNQAPQRSALEFPASGSIHYSSPWADIARAEGGGWDVDLIATEFRAHMTSKNAPLSGTGIEQSFRGFCQGFKAKRGAAR